MSIYTCFNKDRCSPFALFTAYTMLLNCTYILDGEAGSGRLVIGGLSALGDTQFWQQPRAMLNTSAELKFIWLILIGSIPAGTEGYHTFRIPALVRSNEGTLLAFCEGRRTGGGDSGDIDIVLKRSFDNGESWQPMQVAVSTGTDVDGNPAPVVDRDTGTIYLLFCKNLEGLTTFSMFHGFNRSYRSHPMPIMLEGFKVAQVRHTFLVSRELLCYYITDIPFSYSLYPFLFYSENFYFLVTLILLLHTCTPDAVTRCTIVMVG